MEKKFLTYLLLLMIILQTTSCMNIEKIPSDLSSADISNVSSESSESESKVSNEKPRYNIDFVINGDGKVYGCGHNSRYGFGLGHNDPIEGWVEIPIDEKIIKVCNDGYSASFFLTDNGNVYYTGLKLSNQGDLFGLIAATEDNLSDELFVKTPQKIDLNSINEKITDIEWDCYTLLMTTNTNKAYILTPSMNLYEYTFPENIISGQVGISECWFLSESCKLYSLEITDAENGLFNKNPKPELRAVDVVYYNVNVRTIHYIDKNGELYGAGNDDLLFGFITDKYVEKEFLALPIKYVHDFQKVELPEKVKYTFKYTDGFLCAVGVSGKVYVCENKNFFTKKEKIDNPKLMTYSGWDIDDIDSVEELWFSDYNLLKIKHKDAGWAYLYIFGAPEGLKCFEFYPINID